jgi:hypothetical protein
MPRRSMPQSVTYRSSLVGVDIPGRDVGSLNTAAHAS